MADGSGGGESGDWHLGLVLLPLVPMLTILAQKHLIGSPRAVI